MTALLDIVTTTCIGLMIGVEFAVSAFINPILRQLDPAARADATRLFARKLGFVMPFWYAGSFVLLLAEGFVRRHTGGLALLLTASGIWAAVIVLTLAFLVPINNRIIQLPQGTFPPEAEREHRRWDRMHRVRVAALTAAMICFLIAARS